MRITEKRGWNKTMNFKNELKILADRMFNNELLDALLTAYQQEAEKDGYEIMEKEYRVGAKTLSSILNEEQKATLSKMENLCEKNVRYVTKFGFTSGIFVGFQQWFVEQTTKQPFEDFVVSQILEEPNMRKYGDYYQRRCEINDINAALDEQLDADSKEHLISIYSAWDNRLYGVLRHSFYLGYRYALSVINCVKPLNVSLEMISKTLLTEYELGFISPLSEQENQTVRHTSMKKEEPQTQRQPFVEGE